MKCSHCATYEMVLEQTRKDGELVQAKATKEGWGRLGQTYIRACLDRIEELEDRVRCLEARVQELKRILP